MYGISVKILSSISAIRMRCMYVNGDKSSLCGLIDSVRFSCLLDQMTVVVGKKVNLIVLKGYVLKE